MSTTKRVSNGVSVIFPMAGLGTRFGGVFKPFLKATDDTFIELAKKPFDVLLTKYDVEFVFIYRESQESQYDVSTQLSNMFPNNSIRCLTVPDTKGPFETLWTAINDFGINGHAFVCDCDHSIDITPMLEKLDQMVCNDTSTDVVIPTWPITESAEYRE